MSKLTIGGCGAWLCGFLLFCYHGIFSLVKQESAWQQISMIDLFSIHNTAWLDQIAWPAIQGGIICILHMPFFLFLVCVGLVFFICNGLEAISYELSGSATPHSPCLLSGGPFHK